MTTEQGPDLIKIIGAISDDAVARLEAASYPALAGGAILVGRQHVFEHVPPRVIMTPIGSVFSGRDVYASRIKTSGAYTTEAKREIGDRSIVLERIQFEIRCWGVASVEDKTTQRDEDYNATRGLYHAVIQSILAVVGPLTTGGVELSQGRWTDVSLQSVFGREFVFGVMIPTPILDRLAPFDFAERFAPAGVIGVHTGDLVDQTGNTETGC